MAASTRRWSLTARSYRLDGDLEWGTGSVLLDGTKGRPDDLTRRCRRIVTKKLGYERYERLTSLSLSYGPLAGAPGADQCGLHFRVHTSENALMQSAGRGLPPLRATQTY